MRAVEPGILQNVVVIVICIHSYEVLVCVCVFFCIAPNGGGRRNKFRAATNQIFHFNNTAN